jgi:hypothetical protein
VTLTSSAFAGTLGGTTTVAAVEEVATFSALTLNNTGDELSLRASGNGLTSATTTSFSIVCSQLNAR